VNSKQTDALERVMDLVRFLRTHCPWDAAQTHRSLIPYLLEEAHEAADAIADGDDHALRAELGDLLLNVAFQLVLAQERQAFEASDVADTVIDKMQRRHPDLYGLGGAEEWETMKAKERDTDHSTLHGVARGLDPLSKAHRIQDRVAAIGFDWADAGGAFGKVVEELEEVRRELYGSAAPQPHDGTAEPQPSAPVRERQGAPAALEEELGDLLFAVVNLSRLAGVHSLTALHSANTKFTRRFHALERLAAERGVDLETAGLERLDALWEEIKAGERATSD
jgi:nucleoside triphosphate diphosphatase